MLAKELLRISRLLVAQSHTPASPEDVAKAPVVIMFKDQKLMDLWENFIEGQLSDGAWEHSGNTEWLWRDSVSTLGPKNIIYVQPGYKVGRKWYEFATKLIEEYDMTAEMMEESGMQSPEEVKKALGIFTKMTRFPSPKSKMTEQQTSNV